MGFEPLGPLGKWETNSALKTTRVWREALAAFLGPDPPLPKKKAAFRGPVTLGFPSESAREEPLPANADGDGPAQPHLQEPHLERPRPPVSSSSFFFEGAPLK